MPAVEGVPLYTIGTKLAQKFKSYGYYIFSTIAADSSLSYEFTFEPIKEDFVLRQLQQLKTNKAIGLDNISARLLKDSATVISASLTRLFNLSLETRIFPFLWKSGKVTALFKKGDRCDANNYRPITVLPTISKILEKAVHIQLYAYLKNNEIITSKQFGFRPKLSTGTALAHFTDNILQNMDAGSFVGAVFLDLSKAFDTVDHHLLLRKLMNIGLTSSTTQWFRSYLTNRSQITSVGDALSSATKMPVGVPQGSLLGPLLFLIYVNDLPDCHLASDIILYADDTVVYYSSKSVSDLEHHINADLRTVSEWFSRNLLTLNISKCKFVIFGSPQKLNRIQNILVKVEDTCIERTQSFKYLGVTLNQSMSWTDHVDAISTKINQRIGLIRRIRDVLPLQVRVTLYNTLILPLFDYGDVIWGDKNNDTIMSEQQILQNKAAKVLLGQPPRSSSTEALRSLDLKSLSVRFFHRCTAIHKCLIGETDFNFNFIKNQAVHSYNTRRSNDLRLPLPRTNWGKQTFIYQAAKDWNSLPTDLKKTHFLSIFKSKLKTFLKDFD